MRFEKTSKFFYHIMGKYSLKRKDLAHIMEVKRTHIYNYLSGFCQPKREDIEKLALHLHEEPLTFFGLCFEPGTKDDDVGKADFPNVRTEIVKHCLSRANRLKMMRKNGVHDYELFLGGYLLMVLEEKKNFDTQQHFEILDKKFCRHCLEELEHDEHKLNQIFEIPGRWAVTKDDEFYFENSHSEHASLRFFERIEDALRFQEDALYSAYESQDEELLIKDYRKLPDHQKNIVREIIKEKLTYIALKQQIIS